MSTAASHDTERFRRPSGPRSLILGETKVSFVPDGSVQLAPRGWLPDAPDEVWTTHAHHLDADGYFAAGVGGLLVERGDRALLIDAGFGPTAFPVEPGTPVGEIRTGGLIEGLAALGRTPDQVEAVAFTHLHVDHVGWAWQPAPGSERPAFDRAAYLVAEPEWKQRDLLAAHGTSPEMVAALAPRVRTVADGEEVFPGVRVRLVPGHTPGHAAYVISGGGRRLIAFGDALHSPVQVGHPEWPAFPDHDGAQAVEHRRQLVAELQQPDTIGFGIHFADVVFGRVRVGPDGPVWQPVDA
ncbi:MBL fold metallo-hydrolase [Streptomyces sp. HSW2009]|uniref:MBL fold metallo-hydrolase n=1 Tax=Streptomyces sp. HSW2009 TaxID=3142890 RepID=UPI0032EB41EC